METTTPTNLPALFGRGKPTEGVVEAARRLLAARWEKEEVEAALKERNEAVTQAEAELIRQMDAAGLKSMKMDAEEAGTLTLTASSTSHYNLPAGSLDNPAVVGWLVESGGKDLIKASIHHHSFSAFCRELAESGKAIHQDVKKIERRLVSVRKG